jgi:hypothetical protein
LLDRPRTTFQEVRRYPDGEALPARTEGPKSPEPRAGGRGIRKGAQFVAWKYYGETDGILGCLTGKIDAREPPDVLAREFGAMPYALDGYRVKKPEVPKPRAVHPRDLFALSLTRETKDVAAKLAALRERERQEWVPQEPDTQLFLEAEDCKRLPLVASRLRGR